MNKRIFVFITVVCFILCIYGTSLANKVDYSNTNFDIRNGIGYGSTMSSVKSIEDSNSNVEFFYQDGAMFSYKGQIAGYKGSQVFYYFSGGKLSYFYYRVGATSDGEQKYQDVINSLVDKYGEPDIRDIRYSTTSHPLFVHEYSPYEKYSQWFVEYADCYIVVTLYTEDIFGSLCCFLKYDLYSPSEMKALFTQYQNEMDKIQNQRESDL